ncbi:MAG TPA: dihydrodipicolinate synthase family protein, partial [Lacipirellulaceae bacterium]|nr:dihydrodipicolinate synthase family protein [Lacipirellulaceae bacterium]
MRPISTFLDSRVRESLAAGIVIPAHPLALTASRRLDERRQRGLTRYYLDAGVGGLAVGVHTTQFAIRNPSIGLFRPVLELAAEEMDHADTRRAAPVVRIGGICGTTTQAVSEAVLLREYGYHLGLLSLSALKLEDVDALIEHCRCIGEVIPLVGFYLQEAVGGRHLPYEFWRRLCELDSLAAIKIAPFNRYRTLDVVRAVIDSGRDDVALYTGNDDNIVADLLTAYRYPRNGERVERRIVGGLL